jgi:hypothetical protein
MFQDFHNKMIIPAHAEYEHLYDWAINREFIHLFTQWENISENGPKMKQGWHGLCGFWIMVKTERLCVKKK